VTTLAQVAMLVADYRYARAARRGWARVMAQIESRLAAYVAGAGGHTEAPVPAHVAAGELERARRRLAALLSQVQDELRRGLLHPDAHLGDDTLGQLIAAGPEGLNVMLLYHWSTALERSLQPRTVCDELLRLAGREPARHVEVLVLRRGPQALHLQEIAAARGVTRERIRQIANTACPAPRARHRASQRTPDADRPAARATGARARLAEWRASVTASGLLGEWTAPDLRVDPVDLLVTVCGLSGESVAMPPAMRRAAMQRALNMARPGDHAVGNGDELTEQHPDQ
jgi:hypothetical protein